MSKAETKNFSNTYEFIIKQKTIRMSMANAGGYGDQVACLHTIRWLRTTGFTGEIEIIYGQIVYKLVKLLGIEDQFIYGVPFKLPSEKINLVPMDLFATYPEVYSTVELFIAPTSSLAEGRRAPFLENKFRANYAVVFEHYPDRGSQQAIHIPIPSLLEAALFLDDPAKRFLLTRKPGLPNLMQMIAQKRVRSWSLYGLSTEFDDINATTTIRLISEVANKLNHEGIVKEPILLLLHNDLSQEDLAPLSEGNSSFLDLRDADFESKANQIENKPVWIVNLGSLPTVIFDALIGESFFPVLLEGANLENIILELGRSYIECGFNGEKNVESYIHKFIDTTKLKLNNEFKTILDKTRGEICISGTIVNPEMIKVLYQFVLASFDTNSSLSHLMKMIYSAYHTPGNDRYLNSIMTRLGEPAISSFSTPPLFKKYSVQGRCNKDQIGPLLSYAQSSEVRNCILFKKFDLTESWHSLHRGIKTPLFFNLLANNDPLIPKTIINYLQKNPHFCSTLRESEACLPKMRDMALIGNHQSVTAVIEGCFSKTSSNLFLQDRISEFCYEPLFNSSLVPAQQTVRRLVHLFLIEPVPTPKSDFSFVKLTILLSSMLVILALIVALFRNTNLIPRNINFYRFFSSSRKGSNLSSKNLSSGSGLTKKI